jgi:hypothetical protein
MRWPRGEGALALALALAQVLNELSGIDTLADDGSVAHRVVPDGASSLEASAWDVGGGGGRERHETRGQRARVARYFKP